MTGRQAPPPGFARTRDALQMVGVHILARRREFATGRIGLRASAGGIATPAFGEGPEVVRTSGAMLVHETGGTATAVALTTLRDAATAVGVDLDAPLSVGHDTPPVGDPDAPLGIDAACARLIGDWFGLVAAALDEITAARPGTSVAQLWPEHFDLAVNAPWGTGEGDRVNLGGSAGDAGVPEPYVYVGPWGPGRPGDPGFWNAPFGAVLRGGAIPADPDAARAAVVAFFRRGLDLLAAG